MVIQSHTEQSSAPRSQAAAETASPVLVQTSDDIASPTPWELVEANENHGAYIVSAYGADVCDLYAMSNPTAASVRNGGDSFPVHFRGAAVNAALIVKAVNSRQTLLARVARLEADLLECREYLETEVDVIDGSNGEPMPNRAMSLVSMIDETLNGRPY